MKELCRKKSLKTSTGKLYIYSNTTGLKISGNFNLNFFTEIYVNLDYNIS